MLNALDKEVVLGQVLPQLAGLQSREPAVLMSALGIYHAVFHSKKFTVTRQYLASSVIPHLLSLSLTPSLNVTQVGLCVGCGQTSHTYVRSTKFTTFFPSMFLLGGLSVGKGYGMALCT